MRSPAAIPTAILLQGLEKFIANLAAAIASPNNPQHRHPSKCCSAHPVLQRKRRVIKGQLAQRQRYSLPTSPVLSAKAAASVLVSLVAPGTRGLPAHVGNATSRTWKA